MNNDVVVIPRSVPASILMKRVLNWLEEVSIHEGRFEIVGMVDECGCNVRVIVQLEK